MFARNYFVYKYMRLNLKFANGSFDVVWNQSVFMNINNKSQLLTEIHRVLHKDGIFVFEAQMKGDKCESRFPVLWADSPEMSYMKGLKSLFLPHL